MGASVLASVRSGRLLFTSSRLSNVSKLHASAWTRSFCSQPMDREVIVRKQVEYYLSTQNLQKDRFLQSRIAQHNEGWVPLELIMTFNKMKSLEVRQEETIEALKESEIEVKEVEGKYMLRRKGFAVREIPEKGYEIASNVPCKYFAASGLCLNHLNNHECIEYVGNK
eukprot:765245-Hanusia_phi.AAC.1